MANNIIQVKRTNVSGRTPNTSSSGNSQYIAAGELALNMSDGILFTSNGSSLIEVGSNNTSQNISTNNLTVGNTLYVVANGNVGIGTASPTGKLHAYISSTSQLIFQNVSQNNLYVGGINASVVVNSSAGSFYPSYQILLNGSYVGAFGADATNSLSITAGTPYPIVFNTQSGIERMRITSAGNLGIGTASPTEKLQVAGNIYVQNTYSILIGSGGGQKIFAGGADNSTFLNFSQWTGSAYTERMRISTNGNVGIGNSTPAMKLHVEGSFKVSSSSYMAWDDSGNWSLQSDASNWLRFIVNSSERMRIDANGIIGVGVVPAFWTDKAIQLGYSGAFWANPSSAYVGISNNSRFNNPNYIYLNNGAAGIYSINPDGSHNWLTANSGTAGGTITWQQRMIITANGNIGIGITNTGSWRTLISQAGDTVLQLNNSTGDGTRLYFSDVTWSAEITHSRGDLFFKTGGTTVNMYVGASGNVGIGTTTPTAKLDVNGSAKLGSVTVTGNTTLQSALIANGSPGVAGQILTSNSTGVYWSTPPTSTATSFSLVNDQYVGNGSVNTYTLSVSSTTNSAIVAINGVVQEPTDAYSISGTTLTFTENIANGASIDVRIPQFEVGGFLGYSNNLTTSNTSQQVLDSFSATEYRSASYFAQVTDNTNNNYHVQNITLVHNGSAVFMSEFGAVYSNGSSLATFDASISSNTLLLVVTPIVANTTIKLIRTTVVL